MKPGEDHPFAGFQFETSLVFFLQKLEPMIPKSSSDNCCY